MVLIILDNVNIRFKLKKIVNKKDKEEFAMINYEEGLVTGNLKIFWLENKWYMVTLNKKKVVKKPYQLLAWTSTFSILIGAVLASLLPELYIHHFFFIFGNGLLALTAYLWKENSLLVLNTGLCFIYIFGTFYEYI